MMYIIFERCTRFFEVNHYEHFFVYTIFVIVCDSE